MSDITEIKSKIRAPSIPTIFTSEDLRDKYLSILKHWKKKFPLEYHDTIEHVKKMRQHLNDKGISEDGLRLWKGSIPARVLYTMNSTEGLRRLGLPRNWMDSPKFGKVWWEEVRAFCLNESSIPTFRMQDRVQELEEDEFDEDF